MSNDCAVGYGIFHRVRGVDGDKIGCESIYLYKKINGEWSFVTRLLENYTGMSVTESGSHANTITIGCNDGVEYKVVVTLFTENRAEQTLLQSLKGHFNTQMIEMFP